MAPDAIYASPLQRAHHTARAIAGPLGLEVRIEPRLAEFSLGDWEGASFQSITDKLDVGRRLFGDPDFAPPNGDSQLRVRNRMVAALEEILDRHGGENVVVVSHGVAMGIAFSHYLHDDTTRWMDYIKQNTAYSEFCPRRRQMTFFNRTDHLD
jgi:broad specificity phosphatase PhoE